MTTIQLETKILAPIEKVFDLSLDIDFHMLSASDTSEKAIDGRTSGLIKLNETVRWRGKHFGVFLTHTSKISAFERPHSFTDIMIKGHFKSFEHEHYFEAKDRYTLMTDILKYETPYGIFGSFFNRFLLKKHLTVFLKKRNIAISKTLENDNNS